MKLSTFELSSLLDDALCHARLATTDLAREIEYMPKDMGSYLSFDEFCIQILRDDPNDRQTLSQLIPSLPPTERFNKLKAWHSGVAAIPQPRFPYSPHGTLRTPSSAHIVNCVGPTYVSAFASRWLTHNHHTHSKIAEESLVRSLFPEKECDIDIPSQHITDKPFHLRGTCSFSAFLQALLAHKFGSRIINNMMLLDGMYVYVRLFTPQPPHSPVYIRMLASLPWLLHQDHNQYMQNWFGILLKALMAYFYTFHLQYLPSFFTTTISRYHPPTSSANNDLAMMENEQYKFYDILATWLDSDLFLDNLEKIILGIKKYPPITLDETTRTDPEFITYIKTALANRLITLGSHTKLNKFKNRGIVRNHAYAIVYVDDHYVWLRHGLGITPVFFDVSTQFYPGAFYAPRRSKSGALKLKATSCFYGSGKSFNIAYRDIPKFFDEMHITKPLHKSPAFHAAYVAPIW